MTPDAYVKMAKIESSHWWFYGRRAVVSSILMRLPLKKDLKILEVGCGTGGNLKMLNKFGVVSAFEMDKVAFEISKGRAKESCNIKTGSCPDNIPFINEHFDLICMLDVLEHIPKDSETLIKLRGMLKPDGLLLITVPAYQWLYGPHDVFLHHQRRYAAKNLLKLTAKAELDPVKITYFNTILFFPFLLIRLKDKILRKNETSGIKQPCPPLNNMLKYIFLIECHLLKSHNLLFGSSLLGVFKISNNINIK